MSDKLKISDTPNRFNFIELVSQVKFLSSGDWNINNLFLELSNVEANKFSEIELPLFHRVFWGKVKDSFYIGPMLYFQILVAEGFDNRHSFSKIED